MMKEGVDIIVPDEAVALNDEKKERMAKTKNYEKADRVPVIVNVNQWSMLAARGVTFKL